MSPSTKIWSLVGGAVCFAAIAIVQLAGAGGSASGSSVAPLLLLIAGALMLVAAWRTWQASKSAPRDI